MRCRRCLPSRHRLKARCDYSVSGHVRQYRYLPGNGVVLELVEVRRIFHKLRSVAMENFNEHFKGIFDGHGQVPTKGLIPTQRFALGAIFVYQLALLYRFENDLDLCVGLKAFLKAA